MFAIALALLCLALYSYLSASQRNIPEQPILAVLPFADFSPDTDSQKLANGLADALIDNLYQVPSLRVMSRHSTFNHGFENTDVNHIIRALSADYVLSGSVQRVEQKIRVVATLFDKSANPIWSQTFDDSQSSLFALQDKIGLAVKANLSPQPNEKQTDLVVNPEAYDAYVSGTYLYLQRTPESVYQGTKLLEKAVKLAPDFAKAHVALANSYAFQFGHAGADYDTIRQQAEDHLQRALELAPGLSNAYATKGMLLTQDAVYAQAEAKNALLIEAQMRFKPPFPYQSVNLIVTTGMQTCC